MYRNNANKVSKRSPVAKEEGTEKVAQNKGVVKGLEIIISNPFLVS